MSSSFSDFFTSSSYGYKSNDSITSSLISLSCPGSQFDSMDTEIESEDAPTPVPSEKRKIKYELVLISFDLE